MVALNLQQIKDSIQKTGVKTSSIHIVGVTKFQPVEKVQEALAAGVLDLAVNYAQEGEKLMESLAAPEKKICWHFIGHIQSRKIKYLPDYDTVQSFDRLDIAKSLNQILDEKKKKLQILIEINVAGEVQKSGISPDSLAQFLEALKPFPNLVPKGLMTMPPLTDNLEEARRYFKSVRRLYEDHKKTSQFEYLSMGTSSDYITAIEEGANMIRLGTCLFGKRS